MSDRPEPIAHEGRPGEPSLPLVLYKFTSREHAESMVERGLFQIGTLYGYRDQEKLGDEQGDAGEGTAAIYRYVDDATWQELKSSRVITKGIIAPDDATFRIKGISFESPENSPDAYIYCLTTKVIPRAFEEFGDTCVRIHEPRLFLDALAVAMRDHDLAGPTFSAMECVYDERRVPEGTLLACHPAFLKPPQQSWQNEFRVAWDPLRRPPEKQIIRSLRATKYLSYQ